jgi:hypothetical protein
MTSLCQLRLNSKLNHGKDYYIRMVKKEELRLNKLMRYVDTLPKTDTAGVEVDEVRFGVIACAATF